MKETEIKFRKAVYELFRIIRMNAYMKKAQTELEELLSGSETALAMYEGAPGAEKLDDAKEHFENLLLKVKESYGNRAISGAYNSFKAVLDDPDFRKELGHEDPFSSSEKSELFKKLFDIAVPRAESWNKDEDYFSFFVEALKEVIMPTEDLNTDPEEVCPYCDGNPRRITKSEFFGPHSGKDEGYVWGCDCGAYAIMNDEGKVLGKLGDAILHQKRSLVKGAMCELCTIAGITCFESYRWFSLITGTKLNSVSDAEYLSVEQCNLALRIFI